MIQHNQFSLKWNDYQYNVSSAFESLRADNDLTDVTLACHDNFQIEAHKVILASSSPFFSKLFKTNKHPHPMIYMRGMTSEDLVAMIDFLYLGETNIYEENLENFLNIADELSLKGLMKSEEPKEDKAEPDKIEKLYKQQTNLINQPLNRKTYKIQKNIAPEDKVFTSEMYSGDHPSNEMMLALPNKNLSRDWSDQDEKIETMIGRSDNMLKNGIKTIRAYVCQMCKKEGFKSNIKSHIKVHHL